MRKLFLMTVAAAMMSGVALGDDAFPIGGPITMDVPGIHIEGMTMYATREALEKCANGDRFAVPTLTPSGCAFYAGGVAVPFVSSSVAATVKPTTQVYPVTGSTVILRRMPPDASGFVDMVDPTDGKVLYSYMPPGACVERKSDGRSICVESRP